MLSTCLKTVNAGTVEKHETDITGKPDVNSLGYTKRSLSPAFPNAIHD